MINWRVRLRNKVFWITIIPVALLAIQVILAITGVEWRQGAASDCVVNMMNAVLVILAAIGIVADPTTSGVSDSERVKTYMVPVIDGEVVEDEEEENENEGETV